MLFLLPCVKGQQRKDFIAVAKTEYSSYGKTYGRHFENIFQVQRKSVRNLDSFHRSLTFISRKSF